MDKKHLAITLLEALIVMIITIILTIAAVPAFMQFLQEHRVIMTADSVFAAMQYARSEAIKQNTTVYISFQTGDTWCYGINTGSSCNCSIPSTCNLGTGAAPSAQQVTLSVSGLTN